MHRLRPGGKDITQPHTHTALRQHSLCASTLQPVLDQLIFHRSASTITYSFSSLIKGIITSNQHSVWLACSCSTFTAAQGGMRWMEAQDRSEWSFPSSQTRTASASHQKAGQKTEELGRAVAQRRVRLPDSEPSQLFRSRSSVLTLCKGLVPPFIPRRAPQACLEPNTSCIRSARSPIRFRPRRSPFASPPLLIALPCAPPDSLEPHILYRTA